jgi:hypothetical protein
VLFKLGHRRGVTGARSHLGRAVHAGGVVMKFVFQTTLVVIAPA